MSNLSLSQTSNTNPTRKCFEAAQVDEIYKGLNQNIYLKDRLSKTESSLEKADLVIKEQKLSIENNKKTIILKDELYDNLKFQCEKDKEILTIENKRLIDTHEIERQAVKKEKRKSFWNGVKVGGITVGVLGTAGVLLLLK